MSDGELTRYGFGHCAVCSRSVRAGMLMCPAHWRQVPPSLQREVYAQLGRWNAGDGSLADLRAAQDAAVASIDHPSQEPLL